MQKVHTYKLNFPREWYDRWRCYTKNQNKMVEMKSEGIEKERGWHKNHIAGCCLSPLGISTISGNHEGSGNNRAQ